MSNKGAKTKEQPTIIQLIETPKYTSRTMLPVNVGTPESYTEKESSKIEFRENSAKQEMTGSLAVAQNGKLNTDKHYVNQNDLAIERGYPKTFTSTKNVAIKFVTQKKK